VQVECGILKRFPFKSARSQAGFLLNIILKPTSVKDGLAVAEQGENAGIPRPSALHLHIVMASVFIFLSVFCDSVQGIESVLVFLSG
jgi:hypothetical protein